MKVNVLEIHAYKKTPIENSEIEQIKDFLASRGFLLKIELLIKE